MIFFIGVFLIWGSSEGFVAGYFCVLCAIFVITTISYDEFENGYGYLMTLPIERKDYVKEKYLFGVTMTLFGWGMGMILQILYDLVKQTSEWKILEILASSALLVSSGLGVIAVMLPFIFKFGQEKAGFIFFGIIGGICGMGYLGGKLVPQVGKIYADILNSLFDMKIVTLSLGVLLIMVIFYLISSRISIKIMEKKEL